MRLSVNLVAWNGAKYIPYLMKSLRNQTFKDWSLFVLDNHSTDNTLELIKRETEDFPVFVEIVENPENLGFAGGHNLAFQKTESDYVLLLNQDTYLQPDYLAQAVSFMDAHQDTAAVSGRLMKWDFAALSQGLEKTFTNQIDSLGFKILKNRRVVENLAGVEWQKQLTAPTEVFGVSGTLPVYCREALQEVSLAEGQIFDSLYSSYKEDVDLAYRFQLQGLKAYILPEAVAFHDRTMAGPKTTTDLAAIKNKRQQSARLSFFSYRNHLLNLSKNEMWQNILLDFFP
ncbi:MAG TPA: glycosyltransferase family 2 protein, partial [Candidatus Magasanikbacteria bacterium]|nr:glycosyltransferase family 2 protein [Candidatus Magasanikbacteria bacterium]